ncbi:hypothetical protein JCM3765_003616 [Sporobolomyces pararoseus]
MNGSTSSSPFPAPPLPLHQQSSSSQGDEVRRGSLRDITTVSFGNPNSLPGPAPSHFFPSVPKAKRDQQRAARLAATSPPPPHFPSHHQDQQQQAPDATGSTTTDSGRQQLSPPPQPREPGGAAAISSPSSNATSGGEDDIELEQRQRAAKYALASHGPFPSTSASSSQFQNRSNSASLRDGSSTSATPTLKSVGGGGSQGTKRRHRDTAERTNWDAASELVRIERERETVIDRWGADGSTGAGAGQREIAGESVRRREPSVRAQKMGSPSFGVNGGDRTSIAGSVADSHTASPRDVEMEDAEGEGDGDEEEDEFDEDDGASVATFKTGASTKSKGKSRGGSGEKEPAKKRSRTLTTPAQTAVLNALLAKTRFPSTETREEVGAQIGMSARRVQIWFQNRRQSQKRLRDREVQDSSIASMPTNASNHSLPMGHGVPVHPHYPYGPPTSDPYAAHRYPHPGQAPPQFQQQRFSGASNTGPFPTPAAAHSQASVHQMQHRQDLSRQTSIDSLASRASFVSAASGAVPNYSGGNRHEEGQYSAAQQYRTQFSNSRSGPSPTTYQPHASTTHPNQQSSSTFPSKLYFPHVPRPEHSGAPSTRIRTESATSAAGDVKLPSLSSLLNGPSGPPSRQQTQQSSNYAAPPPSQPTTSSSSAAPVFNRAIFSPPPSTSFERLRISGPQSPTPQSEQIPTISTSPFAYHPPPLQSQAPTSRPVSQTMSPLRETSPDVLDAAMEAMAYRPQGRSLPPRSTLPPLRSVFGDSTFPTKARGGSKTEADKALMAPISSIASTSTSPFKSNVLSESGPPRLAPISTFPISLSTPSEPLSPTSRSNPAQPFSPSSQYNPSDSKNRSSMASFELRHPPSYSNNVAGWPRGVASSTGSSSNGSGSQESPRHRSSVGSSSRTSLSSERHDK